MKLNKLTPILWTNNLNETIAFYLQILNFTLLEKNEDWGWAVLQNHAIELMLSKPNANNQMQKPVFTGSFYFNVDDVEQIWNSLKSKTQVVYEMETFDWGMREFAILDNNGYILQFGQSINPLNL